MKLIGNLITLLTFPGVMAHEFAHKFFCKLTGVKVKEVCYFRLGNPAGYVKHAKPTKFHQSFFISVGPFIFNSLLSFILFIIYHMNSSIFFLWLAISVGMHAFPSIKDGKNLWDESTRHIKDNFLAVIGYPFALIIWIGSALSIFWFDVIYAGFIYYLVILIFVGPMGNVDANEVLVDEQFSIEPMSFSFYENVEKGTYNISIRSVNQVSVYVFKTIADYELFIQGEPANLYSDCGAPHTTNFNKVCTFNNNQFVLGILNPNKLVKTNVAVKITKD